MSDRRLPLRRMLVLLFAAALLTALLLKDEEPSYQNNVVDASKKTIRTNSTSTNSTAHYFPDGKSGNATSMNHAKSNITGNDTHARSEPDSKITRVYHNESTWEFEIIANKDILTVDDLYAGAWWQSIHRFALVNTSKIENLEGASFIPILQVARGKEDARMAKDWLDFSIEHLSKWWKIAGEHGTSYAVGKLQAYIQRVMASPRISEMMKTTIAVIPHGGFEKDNRTQHIRTVALAATMASLLRHSVGRILVVGHFPTDSSLAQKAFQILQRNNRTYAGLQDKLVSVHTNSVRSRHIRRNIPKGALVDLQRALNSSMSEKEQKQWLGSTRFEDHPWKYVYFTEEDHVLNARQLTSSNTILDEGGIIIPHRLQPIPHWLDLKGIVEDTDMIPESFGNGVVENLNAATGSCCDTTEYPGKQMGPCPQIFWWSCGFQSGRQNHSRLESYDFFRLSEGTGIVNIAATEHARKCLPFKDERGCRAVE